MPNYEEHSIWKDPKEMAKSQLQANINGNDNNCHISDHVHVYSDI